MKSITCDTRAPCPKTPLGVVDVPGGRKAGGRWRSKRRGKRKGVGIEEQARGKECGGGRLRDVAEEEEEEEEQEEGKGKIPRGREEE
ncbi:hypothetical protein E2C01_077203 [Portunus trituberculatus]|uniref:Uncharacterized protein n=1 Tax=Portunus trituberculatus TaxID=210409 RepID=A0A5B7IAT1_PORTR|nr:hypothetical protein [Portunus trituberculatus]